MSSVATIDKTRMLLNMLIFDPNAITWKKGKELEAYSENKVLEIYNNVVRETGHINFDEVIVRILFHNEVILMEVISEIAASEALVRDEIMCDNSNIYNRLTKGEVSCRDTIPDYVCRILNKHRLSYIPFMENKYNNPVFRAFGVEGVCVVNDCQNKLFQFEEDVPCTLLGLKEVYSGQCDVIRTLLDAKGMIA